MRTGTAFVVGLSLVSGLAFLAPEPPAARSAEETAVGRRAEADLRAAAVEFVRSLSDAEREVALLLLKGVSLKEIAEARGTAERTVRQQAAAVYAKAGVSGRSELASYFLDALPSSSSSSSRASS